jgi:hypothetical protein
MSNAVIPPSIDAITLLVEDHRTVTALCRQAESRRANQAQLVDVSTVTVAAERKGDIPKSYGTRMLIASGVVGAAALLPMI